MEILSSTEAVTIDLVAMRNWHFQASLDKNRSAAMRRWHRTQYSAVDRKIPRKGPGSLTPVKMALVEFLSERYRKLTLKRTKDLLEETPLRQEAALGFEWRQFVEAAQKRIENASHR